jgi:hypothetical protein
MKAQWWHFALILILGIAIDYWFPGLANATLGKVTPRK